MNCKPPKSLEKTQHWFGKLIGEPLDGDGKLASPVHDEACDYIKPSPTLAPHQRLEIYNQQYWYRLNAALQETFPMTLRLFGYGSFNDEIAIPYICAHRPTSWSLNNLGDHLPAWVDAHYPGKDRPLIALSSKIDWAFENSFVAGKLSPIAGDPADLFTKPLALQPHIHLIQGDYDLLAIRRTLLDQPVEYWLENDLPHVETGDFYWAIYRQPTNKVAWRPLSKTAYDLLTLIDKGTDLQACCSVLEDQPEAADHLPSWLAEWTANGWLVPHAPTTDTHP